METIFNQTIFTQIQNIGIVPVVKLENVKDAVPLAKALLDGGLPCAEITFRTAAAEESIRNIVKAYPDMLVGAGTVLTLEQLNKAIYAGAKFIVSPGFNPEIVKASIKQNIPIYPGCSSPTDIEAALSLGIKTVKFFPAENIGGIAAIKAMSGPYGDVTFIPTGGINAKNINDYLSFPKVIACGGSWMVDPKHIESGNFAEITSLTREAVSTVLGFKLAHVGINSIDEHIAAKVFGDLFGMAESPGSGAGGQIIVGTNNIQRAKYQLSAQGVSFLDETAEKDAKGSIKTVQSDIKINGFDVILTKND